MTSTSEPAIRRAPRPVVALATLLALAVVAALGLAACGDDDDTAASDTTPDTSATDSTVSLGGPGQTRPDGSQEISPEPGVGQNVRMRPFERAEVAADGTSIDVFFSGGVHECYTVDRVEIDQDSAPGEIGLTLFEGTRPDVDACIEVAVSYVTTVSLDAPVDPSIDVVDGADGLVKS